MEKLVNTNALKGRIVAAGLTQRELARRLGMSENTLSAKINGHAQFMADEILEICKHLGITDPIEIQFLFLTRPSE